MRLGLLGGSFDPPHLAHVAMARVGLGWGLDQVWFVPAAIPPHKREQTLASPWDRYALCALAVAHEPGMRPSAIELERGDLSYTIDTLQQLATEDPERELFLLLGQDNWHTIASWKGVDEIPRFARCMVFGREDADPGTVPEGVALGAIHIPEFGMPYSSREVRQLIQAGDPRWESMVSPLVVEYIARQGLYGYASQGGAE